MTFIESIGRLFGIFKKKTRRDFALFNVLGLDKAVQVSESQRLEMNKIVDGYKKFAVDIDQLYEALIKKNLYGNLSQQEAQTVLSKYSTVQEGMKHIPGRLSQDEVFAQKTDNIVHPILEKLKQLNIIGQEKRLFRDDYIELKKALFQVMFHKFASAEDIPNMNLAISELIKLEMIPNDVSFHELTQHCPIGRWY